MTVEIRPVSISDAKRLTEILNPIIEEGKYTVLDTTYSEQEEEEFIRQFPKRGVFNVAVAKNLRTNASEVVGFQNVEPFADYSKAFDHVGIIGTYVDSSFRGQGIVKFLFESTFRDAKAKGYEKLFAYVREDNARALAAYVKNGFEVIGVAKKHAKLNDQYIGATLIEKLL